MSPVEPPVASLVEPDHDDAVGGDFGGEGGVEGAEVGLAPEVADAARAGDHQIGLVRADDGRLDPVGPSRATG